MSHFNVSLIVWAKSQDSDPQKSTIFEEKRKESRSGSNQGPSAYQPSALPLGQATPADIVNSVTKDLIYSTVFGVTFGVAIPSPLLYAGLLQSRSVVNSVTHGL